MASGETGSSATVANEGHAPAAAAPVSTAAPAPATVAAADKSKRFRIRRRFREMVIRHQGLGWLLYS